MKQEITPREQAVIKAVIIQQLQSLAVELKRTPTGDDITAAYRKGNCVSLGAVRRAFGTLPDAMKAAKLPLRKHQEFTKEQLIAQLQDLSRALGRPLVRKDIRRAARKGTCANLVTFARVFGSPINAFRAAGVQPNRRFTLAELITQYRALARELGRVPRVTDVERGWRRGKCAGYSQFQRVAGGLVKMRRHAGLPDNTKQRYSRDELLDQLRALARKLGRAPTAPEVDAASKRGESVNSSTIIARFGGHNNALQAAGLEVRRPRRYTRMQLLKMLRQLGNKLGRRPTRHELNEASVRRECASHSHYKKQFGSVDKAFEAAGLDRLPAKPLRKTPQKYTAAQLQEQLSQLIARLGRRPRAKDLAAASLRGECASLTAFAARFGGLTKALQAVGFHVESRYMTRERLIEQLQQLTRELRRIPTTQDIARVKGRHSNNATFKRFFGSAMEARKAANLDDVLRELGIEPKHPKTRVIYSRDVLILHLRSLAERLGRTPSVADIEKACTEEGAPGVAAFARKFGGIPAARKSAGLKRKIE